MKRTSDIFCKAKEMEWEELEEGVLIDLFSPLREDFLDGSRVSYFGGK